MNAALAETLAYALVRLSASRPSARPGFALSFWHARRTVSVGSPMHPRTRASGLRFGGRAAPGGSGVPGGASVCARSSRLRTHQWMSATETRRPFSRARRRCTRQGSTAKRWRTSSRLGERDYAVAWTQRLVALRPGDPTVIARLVDRIVKSGDAARLMDVVMRLLPQPLPASTLAPLVASYRRSSQRLTPRAPHLQRDVPLTPWVRATRRSRRRFRAAQRAGDLTRSPQRSWRDVSVRSLPRKSASSCCSSWRSSTCTTTPTARSALFRKPSRSAPTPHVWPPLRKAPTQQRPRMRRSGARQIRCSTRSR